MVRGTAQSIAAHDIPELAARAVALIGCPTMAVSAYLWPAKNPSDLHAFDCSSGSSSSGCMGTAVSEALDCRPVHLLTRSDILAVVRPVEQERLSPDATTEEREQ